MKTEEFRLWLSACKYPNAHVLNSRVSNCTLVEKSYGNLDVVHAEGQFDEVIEESRYSTNDERLKRPKRHKAPIDGNIRSGSATLRSASFLYRKCLDGGLASET